MPHEKSVKPKEKKETVSKPYKPTEYRYKDGSKGTLPYDFETRERGELIL